MITNGPLEADKGRAGLLTQIRRALPIIILGCAFLPELLHAAPPIPYPLWGSPAYSVPYEFDSFSAVEGARMPNVVSTQSPYAYPKYVAHPGLNCDNQNRITQQTGPDTGDVCSEAKTSQACSIPGVDPPYYWSYCQNVGAVTNCLDGTTWDGTKCAPNGKPDRHKRCLHCPPTGNPIHIALGTKSETELDYSASGRSGLRWERFYSSIGRGRWAGLGELWRHTYARSLTVVSGQGTQMVLARRADGSRYYFVLDGGVWGSEPDITDALSEILDATGVRIGWSYVNKANDEVETYDVNGKLLSIADRSGLTTTLGYDPAGRMHSVTDAFGRSLTFTYDGVDRIISMTDPAGNAYQYAYDSSNRLISVTYPATPAGANPQRLYAYENTSFPLALTGITDENGNRYATFAYDTQGQAVETKHLLADGTPVQHYAVSYPSADSATVTDPLGTTRTYSFQTIWRVHQHTGISQPCNACTGLSDQTVSYDANGNIASRIDWNGNRTVYTYDTARNLETQRVEGLTAGGAGTAATRTISTQWHDSFRLPVAIAEPKRITTLAYDANGNLISKTVQATTDSSGAAGFSGVPTGTARTWTYTHTYSGSIPGLIVQTTIDGPRTDVSDTTTYVYDGATGELTSTTNALGHVTTLGNYDAHGRPQQIIDPNGLVTTLTYDTRGRLTARSAGTEVTQYTYDAVGQLVQITLPDGSSLTYSYDGAHRLVGIADNLGNHIGYTLDAMGNRIQEQVFDPGTTLARTRSRVYDNLNRLVQDIGANAATEVTQYGYDSQGNLTAILDALNHQTSQYYDALNRLVATLDPNNGQTRYGYDGLDQLTSVTDPRSLLTSYARDGLGNLAQQVSPDTGVTANTFDAAGNLLTTLDAKNQQTAYQYDALNRLTLVTYQDGSRMQYGYDSGVNGLGRLTSISEAAPGGTMITQVLYAYDAHGRLISETRFIGAQSFVSQYSYDGAGRLNALIYPSGRQVSYTLDPLGRITAITTRDISGTTLTVVSAVTYQPFGGVSGFTFGNGQRYTRSIDLNGRIAGYSLGNASYAVAFDAASRITSIANSANAADVRSFGYDVLDRLSSTITPSTTYGFSYDANGNRTAETIGLSSWSYAYAPTSNRLSGITGSSARTYVEDANGSVTSDGVNGFTYDTRGRLIGAATALGNVSYAVNALGQRYAKTVQRATTLFHYDPQGHLIAETGAAGNIVAEYLYLGDIPVAVWR